MTSNQAILKVLDPHNLSAEQRAALNAFENRNMAEQWPDDPPKEIDETIGGLRFVPRYLDMHQWAVWSADERETLARGAIGVMRTNDNRHVSEFEIYVVPEARRQGFASRLLSLIAGVAESEGRSLLLSTTERGIPSARAFMERVGAARGMRSYTSQLDIRNLNLEEIRQRRERGKTRAKGFEIGIWIGPYPLEYIGNMVEMKELINTAPTEDLDVEEFQWTGEQLRQDENALMRQGIERWTMFARHVASGKVVGFTEIFCKPAKPSIVDQGDTAVHPSFRSKGLGTWLKVEMLQTIADKLPNARYIRTSNAASNTAMLAINHKLGFERYKSWTVWQVGLDKVKSYLEEKGLTHSGDSI